MALLTNKTLGALALLSTLVLASNAQAQQCGELTSGQELHAGQSVNSCGDGRYQLSMQNDGNLVQYDTWNGKALWNTNTFNSSGYCWDEWTQTSQCQDVYSFWFSKQNLAIMQADGNFVVYTQYIEYDQANNIVTGFRYPVWHTHSWNNPGARFAIQDDSNLVVYGPDGRVLWHRW